MGFLPHVLILLSLSLYPSLSISATLCLTLSLHSHYISTLSLSLISLLLSILYWFKKKKGPPVSIPNRRRPGSHRNGQFSCTWRYFLDSWGGYRLRTWILCQLVYYSCFWPSKLEAPMADGEGVGSISAEVFWRLIPSGGRSTGRRLVLYYLLPRLFCIF